MPTTLRVLAPLALTALAAASHAQYSGGFGVSTSALTWNDSATPTGQTHGGARYELSEAYHSTDYHHDYFGSAAGDAHAHGSIQTGTIGCSSSANSDAAHASSPYSSQPFVSTQAHALLWDGVTLAGAGVVGRAIPIQLALDGFTVSSDWTATSLAEFTVKVYDFDFGKTIVNRTVYAAGNTTLDAVIPAGDASLYNGPRHLQVSYELNTYSDASFTTLGVHDTGASFYNTLHFRWDLPQGAAIESSRSGFFNPSPTQAVPEPASMLALGLGAVGLLRRRRK